MRGALSGIKGVEAASYVTGPFASQLLADMGGGSYQNRRAQARRSCSRLGRTKLFGDILQFEPQQANDRPQPVLGRTYARDSNLVGLRSCRDRYTARPRSDLKQLE